MILKRKLEKGDLIFINGVCGKRCFVLIKYIRYFHPFKTSFIRYLDLVDDKFYEDELSFFINHRLTKESFK